VVVANLHRRYTGVSATIAALLPHQGRLCRVGLFGRDLRGADLCDVPRLGWAEVARLGGAPLPAGRRWRIWHARRDTDMVAGIVLRDVLRHPWKLVFTSAAQKRHGRFLGGLIGRMDAVIATTEGAAGHLDRPAVVIPHGVDTDRFYPPDDQTAVWQESGLPGRFGIGCFGRIRPSKGTDLFVNALCRVLPKHPDFTAIMTGLCKPEHRGFQEALEGRIAEAGLAGRIVFLGEVSREEIPVWHRRVALCVAPAREEGFGLTPLQAMASGSAVLASTAGAFAQLVREGETGHLVPAGDENALAGRLERLLARPETMLGFGRRGRETAVRDHSIAREAERVQEVYDSLGGG